MKNIFLILVGFVVGSAIAFAVISLKPHLPFFQKTKVTSPQPTAAPTHPPQPIELTGWFASWDQNLANEALPPVMGEFKTFAPMLYRISPTSTLSRHSISNREEIIKEARDRNIPVAPVITDESNKISINRLLTNRLIQDRFIDSLASEAARENFVGWSIDIEALKGSDAKNFSAFIKNAYEKLHTKNLKLYVIVYGREEKESYDPARAHDFKVLGQYADEVQIMTYNYNNEFTSPGGQTPLEWYRSVLKYAVKTIPREKILIGLSTHGYDWSGEEVIGLTFPDVTKILEGHNATQSYDPSQSAQVAKYEDSRGIKHTIYYENAKSIEEKMKIAQTEFGINKFAFWRLSAEDPKLWDAIRRLR